MRYISRFIAEDLKKKMVFLGGPRQCGKTTLALHFLEKDYKGLYLNWDRVSDRKTILDGSWVDEDHLLIFDEVHKYQKWKNLIKGYYDTEKNKHKFIITGSARLDHYQKGGDSLLGRYHYWRLHPFSLYEVPAKMSRQEALHRLLSVGGFPEPFFDNNEREARRWRESRYLRIIREDVRDLATVKDLQLMELLLQILRSKVGSTLAISNLAQEVQVSPVTAGKWIQIFERMYLIFTVKGYDRVISRAVHKPIKVFFYDNGDVDGDESQKFENMVATHLQKKMNFIEDYYGHRMKLHYVRDKSQREVDFLITKNERPIELIEAKLSADEISRNLIHFAEKLKAPRATQIVKNPKKVWTKGHLHLTDPIHYFQNIELEPN